jgi:hypothetical protein
MNLGVATLGGIVMGVAAAAALAIAPAPLVEGLVMDSGLPAVLAAAEPPLGLTARAGLSLGVGGVVALFGWFACFLMFGSRTLSLGREAPVSEEAVPTPVLRRADAHPDAPARAPLLATRDLGVPFLEITAKPKQTNLDSDVPKRVTAEPLFAAPAPESVVEDSEPMLLDQPIAAAEVHAEVHGAPAEQDLPLDLEQPMAAFDPDAILDFPMPPSVAPLPLRRKRPAVFDETERFEIFELTPPIRPRPAPPPSLRPAPRPEPRAQDEAIATPRTDATIHALLERLEKGVVKKGIATGMETAASPVAHGRDQDRGLEDALVTLRNLARRA